MPVVPAPPVTAAATINRAPLTAALLAAFRACLTGGLAFEVGHAPIDAKDLTRYGILYPIEAGGFSGPPCLPESDATLCYQTTCVAQRGDQLEALADVVRRTAMTATLSASGLTIMARWAEAAGGIDADTTLLSLPERYYFAVTTS